MASTASEKVAIQDPIRQLYIEAGNSAKRDRRSDVRFSFFRAVTIELPDGQHLSAFSRDISSSAIGLLHDRELPRGEIVLSIPTQQGFAVRVRVRIARCESCGAGWYISGGEFVGVPTVVE
jgi:hypothetical protein